MRIKRKNRRRSRRIPAHAVFPSLLAGLLIPAMVLALCYLWAGTRCEVLGREIQQLEARRMELGKRLAVEQNRWANLLSPVGFEQLLRRHGLQMSRPGEDRVVRITTAYGQTQLARVEPLGRRVFYE